MRHLGTCTFAATPESVGEARHWLTGVLGPGSDDSVLLLSEGMTNAVLHADGDKVEVRAFANDRVVRIEIVDGGGSGLPHYVDDPNGEHGRGLPIIQAWLETGGMTSSPPATSRSGSKSLTTNDVGLRPGGELLGADGRPSRYGGG